MTRIQALDEYLERTIKNWKDRFKVGETPVLDLKAGAFFEGSHPSGQLINCPRFEVYTAQLKKILSLLDQNAELNPERITASLADTLNATQLRRIKDAYQRSLEHPRTRDTSTKSKNANFVDYVLSRVFALGENYPIRIIGQSEEVQDNFRKALKDSAKFNEIYHVKEISPKDTSIEPREKDTNFGGYIWFSNREDIPDNHLLGIWHGRGIGCARLGLDLAQILKQNNLSASYCLDIGNYDLEGAVYDPNPKG